MNIKKRLVRLVSWKDYLRNSRQDRIEKWGHRAFVGGWDAETWYGIGKRQYHFLVAQGLSHQHRFLDIACGSLRLGQYLIPMLDAGNYYGLEGERGLVEAGLQQEMLFSVAKEKEPRFEYNYSFRFDAAKEIDYAMAQSLFTHLTVDDIKTCLRNIRPKMAETGRLYFTFFEGAAGANPEGSSEANQDWYYPREQMEAIAHECGWKPQYIGDWGHERGQMMMLATVDSAKGGPQDAYI